MISINEIFVQNNHTWLMSSGEKLAIIGLLNCLKPKTSVEIGIYLGATTKLLSSISQIVYSIDFDQKYIENIKHLKNVIPIIKNSTDALKEIFNNTKDQIDFILMDGPHDYNTVLNDMKVIFESDKTKNSFVLIHDTYHQPVRNAIIDCINLYKSKKIFIYDIDLIEGYDYIDHRGKVSYGGFGFIFMGKNFEYKNFFGNMIKSKSEMSM